MTRPEFETLIGAYGANPERWPEDRRTAAEHYLKKNPEAQALLEVEAALDAALDKVNTPHPSEILKARIMKTATGHVSPPPVQAKARMQYWKIAASFAAILAVGGLTYSVYTPQAETQLEETVWLEAANELGVSDIYAWVEGTE